MHIYRIFILLLLSFISIKGITQNNTPKYLVGTWQVASRPGGASNTIYSFKDTINLLIYHPNENKPLFMHFTIDTIHNDRILSIMDVDFEKMSRGYRTFKVIILSNDKITLKPYTFIFFSEKSNKVEERDASKEPEIHLTRIKSQ